MSSHFAKPENALRKGKDLLAVGKPSSALKTLHSILSARRYRLWTPTHEQIMFFYLELAIDLRRNVKDALVQYRMICQQAQFGSLDKVLRYYMQLAEKKAAEAQQKAAEATAAAQGTTVSAEEVEGEVEDLEEESPESIMLAAMSGEGTKERLDRQILTPWIRYLWECYRTILDVLRNNAKLESLYHHTARSAFDFCKRFKRNMEFRRLCEILRNHLTTIQRYQGQTNAIDLNSPETQTLYLETRFQQLKMAADLELWQEAYRTIEDISENMRLGGRTQPPPELMKTYYEKLSQIFWASSNHLFHAYSMHKFYQLSAQEAQSTGADASQRSALASSVVLSALIITGSQQSVDMHDIDSVAGVEHEGNMRLAQLLGFKKESPSRQRILAAVQTSGVLAEASPLSKAIFRLLEHQFGPLTLYAQLKPLLEQLKDDAELSKYVAPLEQLTILRVLQQLSTVFKSIKMDKFQKLVPTIGSVFALERLILSGISRDLLRLRFDHRTMTLIFPEPDLEHPNVKDQLVTLSRNFISIAHTLEAAQQQEADKQKERDHVFKLIQNNLQEEHENVFLRQELIEKRKQELEKMLLEKERREAEARQAAINAKRAEEQRRLAEESARREQERIRQEAAERELRTKQALALEMKKKLEQVSAVAPGMGLGQKAEKKIQALTQDLENIDKVTLLRTQEQLLRAQQREIERRRKEAARRHDYFIRALRLEERDLLLAKMEQTKIDEREQFEADFAKYLEQDKQNHVKALKEKERLVDRMTREKDVFQEKLLARRMEQFQIEKAEQDKRLAIKAEKKRVAEERRRKEEEERERILAIEAEKERKRKEEEARAEEAAAEQRRRKQEELQARLREQQEEQARLDERARLQQQREEEAEAKERERRAAFASSAASGRSWGRPAADQPERERDFGNLRNRPSPSPEAERRPERDFGNIRDRMGAAPEREREAPRWGRGGDARGDAPRRFGGEDRDAPRRFGGEEREREAPRRFGGEERDAPRRFGGEDREAGPRRFGGEERGDFRRGGEERADFRRGGADREPPSREAFGRANADREAPAREGRGFGGGFGRAAGGDRDRDWGALRKKEEPAQGEREFRRREDAPAASSAAAPEQTQQQSAQQDDDGFTTVKKSSRR